MDEPWQDGWGGGRFRIVETTADVGVEAQGESLPSALAAAVSGMYSIISPTHACDGGRRVQVDEWADDLPLAFARALQRLLVAFDAEGFFGASCLAAAYRGERARVVLELRGESFDTARHAQGVEIKAVTHHKLVVDAKACRVEVLFDV